MSVKNNLQRIGVTTLSDMQEQVAQELHQGDGDLLVLSPTGSGKTLAYLLPLTDLLDDQSTDVQAVVVVPSRELALQSATVLADLGSTLTGYACYGGRTAMMEHRLLRQQCPQMVFATPGRLADHLEKGNIVGETVRWLVIDEFDKCLEMGFADEMEHILGMLPRLRRRVLLSATDAPEIPRYLRMERTVRLDFLGDESQPADRIRSYVVRSPQRDKLATLDALLRSLGNTRSIVFLNHRDSVERTYAYLREQGFHASFYHGGLEQKDRETALYKFANDSANVLVCTDLASRGLDIQGVEHIIHYHLPETADNHTHRIGRTARWEATGNSYFLLGPGEEVPAEWNVECEAWKGEGESPNIPVPSMATLYIGKGKRDKISKGDILGFLCKKGQLAGSDIGRIDVKDRYAYVAVKRSKMKGVMRLIQHEKLKGFRTVFEEMH